VIRREWRRERLRRQTSSCNTQANATHAASGRLAIAARSSTRAAVATSAAEVPTIPAVTPSASPVRLRSNNTQEKPPTPRTFSAHAPTARVRSGPAGRRNSR
jgi:hypothetical protein